LDIRETGTPAEGKITKMQKELRSRDTSKSDPRSQEPVASKVTTQKPPRDQLEKGTLHAVK